MLGYKNNAGDFQYKKLAITCSREVRSYIMNRNGGYIFVGLCRCKAYDRLFVPQCFHCNEFNHFANTCPNKKTLQNAEKALINTRQKPAGQNSLNSSIL